MVRKKIAAAAPPRFAELSEGPRRCDGCARYHVAMRARVDLRGRLGREGDGGDGGERAGGRAGAGDEGGDSGGGEGDDATDR